MTQLTGYPVAAWRKFGSLLETMQPAWPPQEPNGVAPRCPHCQTRCAPCETLWLLGFVAQDTGSYGRMNIVLPRPSRVSVFALLRVLVACSRALQGTRQTTPCCNCSRVSAPLPLSNQCQRTGAALLPKPQEKPNFACDSAQILHGLPCASRLLR